MSDFDPHDFNNLLNTSVNNGIITPTQGIIPQLEANRTLTGVGVQEVKAQSLTPDTSDNIILGDASQTKMTNGTITDTNTSLPDSAVDLITGQAMSEVYGDLSKFAAESDFVAKMNLAFGENWDAAGAKALAEGWFNRDFSAIPPVKVVSSAEIGGANGAFAAATDTIYLSKEFLAQNGANPVAIADVLLEEVGHSVDARLNVTDTPGDEGAIFAAVVQGKVLSQSELQGLRGEDDRGTVVLGGENTTIEMSQQRWTIWSYSDWKNRTVDWQKPDSTSIQNSTRPDNKNGISINWGQGSPFDTNNAFGVNNNSDYFATAGGTNTYFEGGKTYRFRVSADDGIVLVAVPTGQSGFYARDIITPLSQDKTQIEWQRLNGGEKEYSWTPAQSGSYNVYFWHYEETGDANVDISWEAQSPTINTSGTVTKDGETLPVSLTRVDGDSTDIKNRPTWVVIHGMNSSPGADNIKALSQAIGDYKTDDQVLVLDWSAEAFSDSQLFGLPNPKFGASWISTVADWTKKKLVDEWKILPENINFAGHSLGSYLAWETAKDIGGVNNLIALDPARTTNGGYPSEDKVNFSDYSKWAWAFYGSEAGNSDRASTAEESFNFVFLNGFEGLNPIDAVKEKHGAVVKAFADTIKQNKEQPGYFSSLLNLDNMNSSAGQPWERGDGFEATLVANQNNNNEWVISNSESRVRTNFGNALIAS
jgi:pimeloyl-ACP methyl ester carboxylesterase